MVALCSNLILYCGAMAAASNMFAAVSSVYIGEILVVEGVGYDGRAGGAYMAGWLAISFLTV